MSDLSVLQLIGYLTGRSLRNRTGILLVPLSWLGHEREIASRLGISFDDECERILSQLMPGQRYLGQTWIDLAKDLDGMIQNSRLDGRCLLVANLDIVLSSLGTDDRSLFWSFLYESYKPSYGLLLTLPNEIRRLITEQELSTWTGTGRLAIWDEGGLKR